MIQMPISSRTGPSRSSATFGRWPFSRWPLRFPVIGLVFLLASKGMSTAQEPGHGSGQDSVSYIPPHGFVASAETAIKIAQAVLEPIYGAEQIRRQLPLTAVLDKEAWIVQGSLPTGTRGGVALIEIAKRDGRIIRVTHGR